MFPCGARSSARHELLKESGLIIETHASGTNVEGDLSQILQVVERVHAVLHAEGTVRLITVVKLETRTDKVPTLAGKRLCKLLWAIEQSPASVVITDPEGCIEYVNPKFTKLTGYTLQEMRGKNPRILKSGKMPQEEYQRLWETIKAGGEWGAGSSRTRRRTARSTWNWPRSRRCLTTVGSSPTSWR